MGSMADAAEGEEWINHYLKVITSNVITTESWRLFYCHDDSSMTSGRLSAAPAVEHDWPNKGAVHEMPRLPDAVSQDSNVGLAGSTIAAHYTTSTESQSSASQGFTPESTTSGEYEAYSFVACLAMQAGSAVSSSSADDARRPHVVSSASPTMDMRRQVLPQTTSSDGIHGIPSEAAYADPQWANDTGANDTGANDTVVETGGWMQSQGNFADQLNHGQNFSMPYVNHAAMDGSVFTSQNTSFSDMDHSQQLYPSQLDIAYTNPAQVNSLENPGFPNVAFPQPYSLVPADSSMNFLSQGSAQLPMDQTSPPLYNWDYSLQPPRSTHPHHRREPGPVPLHPSRSVASPTSSSPNEIPAKSNKRGGRALHSKLSDRKKVETANMRKTKACWRCRFQRDKCPDDGDPCKRCKASPSDLQRAVNGHPYSLPCSRKPLPEFVAIFLPESMTQHHTKRTLMDYSNERVLEWFGNTSRIVSLESGYGPPLRVPVCEYLPHSHRDKMQHHLQWLPDPVTGAFERRWQYSLPIGLMKLDATDQINFHEHMEKLLTPGYLSTLPDAFYRTCPTADDFGEELLGMLCRLHEHTADDKVKKSLALVLQMIIVTFIMSHYLSVAQSETEAVLAAIEHSEIPSWDDFFIISSLLNRQLKYHFSEIRQKMYSRSLQQLQTLLVNSGKDGSWLPSFCILLGCAICLEEVQNTVFLQAYTAIAWSASDAVRAQTAASSTCASMDASFDFLLKLFQNKYRDPKWDEGSFGPRTPVQNDLASHRFLRDVHALLHANSAFLVMVHSSRNSRLTRSTGDPLVERESTTPNRDHSHITSRLTARFLLPFLTLQS